MKAYWTHSVDLVGAGSVLALLLAGDGLAPGIGSILTNLGAVMFLLSLSTDQNPEKDRWMIWPLYGFLSLHGFYASGHHTSLPNIPWLLYLRYTTITFSIVSQFRRVLTGLWICFLRALQSSIR